jgi:L-serine dehydratase
MRPAADLFNHVLGPVMTGPSSSHTAGPARIGRIVHDLCGGVRRATIRYSRHGSYAATLRGQGVDRGFTAGLLGLSPDDPRVADPWALAAERGVSTAFEEVEAAFPHPNTGVLLATASDGATHEVESVSTGGGNVRIVSIDGTPIDLDGSRDTYVTLEFPLRVTFDPPPQPHRRIRRVVPVAATEGREAPFRTAGELLASGWGGRPLSEAAVAYEVALSGWTTEEVERVAASLLDVMDRAATAGLAMTSSPHFQYSQPSARRLHAARQTGIPAGVLSDAVPLSTAVMEHNRALGVIVAAPTAGSAGVLPGVLLAYSRSRQGDVGRVVRALLAAGLVGAFVMHQATFAAEEGGCQAENGAASAMAAAALCDLQGSDARTALGAAALALANLLGLICDPVGGGVEMPCIGRNAMAAANAVVAANMVLGGFDPVIPFDEVAQAMMDVGRRMSPDLRCTSRGGLATTPTALRLVRARSQGQGT